MAMSNLMRENEENVRSAALEGISGDAVESTLEDVINVSDSKGKTPQQVKDAVEAIVDMKSDTQNERDEQFASEFVKQNNAKIENALEEGIKPEEIATTLINSTNEATTKKGKKHLNFIVKLISKMKKKELKLKKDIEKSNEKGYQKILTDK